LDVTHRGSTCQSQGCSRRATHGPASSRGGKQGVGAIPERSAQVPGASVTCAAPCALPHCVRPWTGCLARCGRALAHARVPAGGCHRRPWCRPRRRRRGAALRRGASAGAAALRAAPRGGRGEPLPPPVCSAGLRAAADLRAAGRRPRALLRQAPRKVRAARAPPPEAQRQPWRVPQPTAIPRAAVPACADPAAAGGEESMWTWSIAAAARRGAAGSPPTVRAAACPLSTRGGTRLVRLVRGRGGGGCGRQPSYGEGRTGAAVAGVGAGGRGRPRPQRGVPSQRAQRAKRGSLAGQITAL